jgi:accessory colonization factor AcfC
MANPNIVNVTDIRGKTGTAALTTVSSDIVTNSASSNKIYKINTIIVSNVDGTNAADATVTFYDADGTVTRHLAKTISVPENSTLVVLSKDTAIYLEEGDKISALASASGDLEIIVSYEEIS